MFKKIYDKKIISLLVCLGLFQYSVCPVIQSKKTQSTISNKLTKSSYVIRKWIQEHKLLLAGGALLSLYAYYIYGQMSNFDDQYCSLLNKSSCIRVLPETDILKKNFVTPRNTVKINFLFDGNKQIIFDKCERKENSPDGDRLFIYFCNGSHSPTYEIKQVNDALDKGDSVFIFKGIYFKSVSSIRTINLRGKISSATKSPSNFDKDEAKLMAKISDKISKYVHKYYPNKKVVIYGTNYNSIFASKVALELAKVQEHPVTVILNKPKEGEKLSRVYKDMRAESLFSAKKQALCSYYIQCLLRSRLNLEQIFKQLAELKNNSSRPQVVVLADASWADYAKYTKILIESKVDYKVHSQNDFNFNSINN
ncbi:MAG: hypothetical protein NkDv07_0937 [Candidatus Improbicoccus devescovinae]|nr:MAG: hypothetical protein NkDv07_0937 [Candidatus Improbicoccus devescovinae]